MTQIRFLGDPSSAFTNALDLSFDGSSIFGGPRSKRYALTVEAGKVKEAFVEPDNTGMSGESQSLFSFVNEEAGCGREKMLLPKHGEVAGYANKTFQSQCQRPRRCSNKLL